MNLWGDPKKHVLTVYAAMVIATIIVIAVKELV